MSITLQAFFHLLLCLAYIGKAGAANKPAPNPYLADSTYPITHADCAQQAAFGVSGPRDKSRTLSTEEKEYTFLGPGHLIFVISGKYDNGQRLVWSVGVDRIAKQDYDSFSVVDTIEFNENSKYTEVWAAESEKKLLTRSGPMAIWEAFKQMVVLRELANMYTLIDKDNDFYVGESDGAISVYGDAESGNPQSPIKLKRRFELPKEATGRLVGMNMTYDGWLVVVTEHGYLVAVRRDFKQHRSVKLSGAPVSAEKTGDPLRGWIRNSFAVDEKAVYIVSSDYMHRIIWSGSDWSQKESDGAWQVRYPNSADVGSGATPTLMGFDNEDKFVVITDGDKLMNLTLFWREDIPEDWQQLPGTPSRRIAGSSPANMGDPNKTAVQSEQSGAVYGYGAVVVNNEPASIPWYLPRRMAPILVGLLATDEKYRPLGIQKFEWDPRTRQLKEAWVNRSVSSPNSVPLISHGSNMIYTEGARDGHWTMEAVDWSTGDSVFHYVVGGPRFNSMFAPIVLDPDGRIMYGATWGRVRLAPR